MREAYIADLSRASQLLIKRGHCPWCGTEIYDGTLDPEIGHSDVCYDCKAIFVGTLTKV